VEGNRSLRGNHDDGTDYKWLYLRLGIMTGAFVIVVVCVTPRRRRSG